MGSDEQPGEGHLFAALPKADSRVDAGPDDAPVALPNDAVELGGVLQAGHAESSAESESVVEPHAPEGLEVGSGGAVELTDSHAGRSGLFDPHQVGTGQRMPLDPSKRSGGVGDSNGP